MSGLSFERDLGMNSSILILCWRTRDSTSRFPLSRWRTDRGHFPIRQLLAANYVMAWPLIKPLVHRLPYTYVIRGQASLGDSHSSSLSNRCDYKAIDAAIVAVVVDSLSRESVYLLSGTNARDVPALFDRTLFVIH